MLTINQIVDDGVAHSIYEYCWIHLQDIDYHETWTTQSFGGPKHVTNYYHLWLLVYLISFSCAYTIAYIFV